MPIFIKQTARPISNVSPDNIERSVLVFDNVIFKGTKAFTSAGRPSHGTILGRLPIGSIATTPEL